MTGMDRELKDELEIKNAENAVSEDSQADAWSNFQIEGQVAQGAMGDIYKAVHLKLQRTCAIKVLNPQRELGESSLKRFLKEARLVCSLDHPNIVKVFSVGHKDAQSPYFAMEWLEGSSLDKLLKTKTLDAKEFRSVFSQVLDALEYAHSRGIVHRDLKPSNIFVINDKDSLSSENVSTKLLDFGIAQVDNLETSDGMKLTRTGVLLGTPAYMSPEQARGEAVDQRSDIYSIGVVMYEALAGQAPFGGDTALDIMYKHSSEAVDRSRLPKGTSYQALNSCVLKCLEKSPQNRYQNIAELSTEFKSASVGIANLSRAKHGTGGMPVVFALVLVSIASIGYIAFSVLHKREDSESKKSNLVEGQAIPANARSSKYQDLAVNYADRMHTAERLGNLEEARKFRELTFKCWNQTILAAEQRAALLRQHPELERRSVEDDLRGKEYDLEWNRAYNTRKEIANQLIWERQYEQARTYLKQALAMETQNYPLWCRAQRILAHTYYLQGDISKAVKELNLIFEKYPTRINKMYKPKDGENWEISNTYMDLAKLFQKYDDLAEARTNYEKAKASFEEVFDASKHPERLVEVDAGIADCSSSKVERRRLYQTAYDRFIRGEGRGSSTPDFAVEACCRSARFFEETDPAKAKKMYLKIIDDAKIGCNTATLADALKKACGFANESKNFAWNQAFLSSARMSLERGAMPLGRASYIDGKPLEFEQKFANATELFQEGKIPEARNLYLEALHDADTHRDSIQRTNMMLGRCFMKEGNTEKALQRFDLALKNNPHCHFAVSRLFLFEGINEYAGLLEKAGRILEAPLFRKLGAFYVHDNPSLRETTVSPE